MPKIIFVSTSHVARESLEKVRKAVEKETPDCIAIELDVLRFRSMESEKKETLSSIKILGLPTFVIYWVLQKFQEYFGKKTGILPGSEMTEAVRLAKEKRIPFAFIDQRIDVTFYRIQSIPISEKLKLLWILLLALLGMAVPSAEKHKQKIDLNRVPEQKIIEEAMQFLETELPNFYRILVIERNEVMAKNLKELDKRFGKIVCVLGAGHEKGMREILKKIS